MEKIKVAITDDEKLFRKGIAMILEENSFDVLFEAPDGEDLIRELEDAEELPDVILLDMKMKKLNGMETTKILREKYPDLKIIILSTYYTHTFVKYMLDLGINAYLPKNTDPEQVIETIERVYLKGFYFSNEMLKLVYQGAKDGSTGEPLFDDEELKISDREAEILEYICKQYTSSEIAEKLNISDRTVEGHRKNIISKTGVRNTAGLVVFALTQGLVDVTDFKLANQLKQKE